MSEIPTFRQCVAGRCGCTDTFREMLAAKGVDETRVQDLLLACDGVADAFDLIESIADLPAPIPTIPRSVLDIELPAGIALPFALIGGLILMAVFMVSSP